MGPGQARSLPDISQSMRNSLSELVFTEGCHPVYQGLTAQTLRGRYVDAFLSAPQHGTAHRITGKTRCWSTGEQHMFQEVQGRMQQTHRQLCGTASAHLVAQPKRACVPLQNLHLAPANHMEEVTGRAALATHDMQESHFSRVKHLLKDAWNSSVHKSQCIKPTTRSKTAAHTLAHEHQHYLIHACRPKSIHTDKPLAGVPRVKCCCALAQLGPSRLLAGAHTYTKRTRYQPASAQHYKSTQQ